MVMCLVLTLAADRHHFRECETDTNLLEVDPQMQTIKTKCMDDDSLIVSTAQPHYMQYILSG